MKVNAMVTGVKEANYLSGYFRTNEALLTDDEKVKAMVRGYDVLAVEGGSDTVYHYRIAKSLAPDNTAKLAFQAVAIDCTGGSGRTWVNGQSGPVDADVTFTAVEIKPIDLTVIQKEAEMRSAQAATQSEEYKKQKAALNALEQQVRARLQNGQPAATDKK